MDPEGKQGRQATGYNEAALRKEQPRQKDFQETEKSRRMHMEPLLQIKTFGETHSKFMIELVSNDSPAGGYRLLLWDGTSARIMDRMRFTSDPGSEFKPRVFEPPEVDRSIQNAIYVPTHAAEYESVPGLLADVRSLLDKFVGLPDKSATLAAYSVLASWLVDVIPAPVCLSIVGPDSVQGSQLFRLLACLYRRPLVLRDPNLAALLSLPMALRPSFFIEGCETSPGLQKLLEISNGWQSYVPRNGRLISICGAKVIRTEDPLPDSTLGGKFLEIQLEPSHSRLPRLDQHAREEIAGEFQPKLLMYRLKNCNRVADSGFQSPDLLPAMQELACCLGACVPQELQAGIARLLEERNKQLSKDQATNLYAVVVEAMLLLCHQAEKQSVHVAEVADAANAILKQRRESLSMKDKSVGSKLGALGFPTERLDAAGRGIVLLEAVRQRVHTLARQYKIVTENNGNEQCRHCNEEVVCT
jgi:hypothetical protein